MTYVLLSLLGAALGIVTEMFRAVFFDRSWPTVSAYMKQNLSKVVWTGVLVAIASACATIAGPETIASLISYAFSVSAEPMQGTPNAQAVVLGLILALASHRANRSL